MARWDKFDRKQTLRTRSDCWRFLRSIKILDRDSCWEWQGARTRAGYGQIRVVGKREWIYAHRFAFDLLKGKIPADQNVLHICDNPRCVNPDHLKLGTQSENTQDSYNRKRRPRGQKHHSAKLTENAVREIRKLHKEGLSMAALGRRYGCSARNVAAIIKRKSWRDLQ